MKKLFCDRCGRETNEIDMHELKVCKVTCRKPSLKTTELCAFCKEELSSWIVGKVSV